MDSSLEKLLSSHGIFLADVLLTDGQGEENVAWATTLETEAACFSA
jgi:hypothetical protein